MADISDLIKSAVNQTPTQMQNDFAELMLDKIRDIITDKKAEIAQSFIGGQQDDFDDSDDQEEFEDEQDDVDDQNDFDVDDIDLDDQTDELTDDDIQGDQDENP